MKLHLRIHSFFFLRLSGSELRHQGEDLNFLQVDLIKLRMKERLCGPLERPRHHLIAKPESEIISNSWFSMILLLRVS